MTEINFKDFAVKTLSEMTGLMGLDIVCSAQENEGALTINISMDNAGQLIGSQGRTLEALESILNKILKKQDEAAPWATISVDGYTTGQTAPAASSDHHRRGGRRFDDEEMERFEHLALDAAKEVKHWKAPKTLGPFMPAERRAIHTALKDDPSVTTESVPAPEAGSRMKFVVIKLAE